MPNKLEILKEKVNREYDKFITDIRKSGIETAIDKAYDIVWKKSINQYIQNGLKPTNGGNPITDAMIDNLLLFPDTLSAIFCAWCAPPVFFDPEDIYCAVVIASHQAEAISKIADQFMEMWEQKILPAERI